MVWIATHSPHLRTGAVDRTRMLENGTLIAEFEVAHAAREDGLIWESGHGDTALRVHLDPAGTVTAVLGRSLARLQLTERPWPGHALRMSVAWSVKSRRRVLSLSETGGGMTATRDECAAPVRLETLLPATAEAWPSLLYFGVADSEVPDHPVPCFVSGTLIETPDGPVRVEDLRPGMEVLTAISGVQRVRWTGHSDAVGAGPYAPIRLRAPYFGLTSDVRVSRDHKVLLSGPSVEYVTGLPEIFVRAGDLLGGPEAQVDYGQAAIRFHHLMLDRHDCVLSGRCRLETLLLSDLLKNTGRDLAELDPWDREPCAPVADRAAAQELRAHSRSHRRFAA